MNKQTNKPLSVSDLPTMSVSSLRQSTQGHGLPTMSMSLCVSTTSVCVYQRRVYESMATVCPYHLSLTAINHVLSVYLRLVCVPTTCMRTYDVSVYLRPVCVPTTCMRTYDASVYLRPVCVPTTCLRTYDLYAYLRRVCVPTTCLCTYDVSVYLRRVCVLTTCVCTYDVSVYLQPVCVPTTCLCTYSLCVYLRRVCVLTTCVCTYDVSVYLRPICGPTTCLRTYAQCTYDVSVYLRPPSPSYNTNASHTSTVMNYDRMCIYHRQTLHTTPPTKPLIHAPTTIPPNHHNHRRQHCPPPSPHLRPVDKQQTCSGYLKVCARQSTPAGRRR